MISNVLSKRLAPNKEKVKLIGVNYSISAMC
jgi:hypothetical protein